MAILGDYQTVPIALNTFIGIATNEPVRGYRVVFAEEDGAITFKTSLSPTNDKVVTALAGFSYTLQDEYILVSSTASILMS